MIEITFLSMGHTVCLKRSSHDISNEVLIEKEIISWVKENFSSCRIGDGGYVVAERKKYTFFNFISVEDVMAFKLKWT